MRSRGAKAAAPRPTWDMGRPLRLQIAGGIYHVFARGNNRREIFYADDDYRLYLWLLARTVDRLGWQVMAYCLMPNHVHLLVETPAADLGRGMQRFHSDYARMFNERYDMVGHVFQGRYGSKLVLDDPQFAMVVGYIAANPVAAGLCADPAEWRWSSHPAIAGLAPGPSWLARAALLGRLAETEPSAVETYMTLVSDRVKNPAVRALAPIRSQRAGLKGSDPLSAPDSGGLTP